MTMLRRLLFALAASPATLAAQEIAHIAPNVAVTIWYPVPRTLAAFPRAWRDSVRAVIARSVPPRAAPITDLPSRGMVRLTLQVLRTGDLYRATLDRSSGNAEIDSALIAAAWRASDARLLPSFPSSVDGAGREVRLVALLPGTRASPPVPVPVKDEPEFIPVDVPLPPLAPGCDSLLAKPTRWAETLLGARVSAVSAGTGMQEWAARAVASLPEAYLPIGPVTPAGPPVELSDRAPASDTLPGTLHLILDATGRVRGATMITTTEIPALDSALLAFIQRADSLGLIPPPASTQGDTATLDLNFVAAKPMTNGWYPLGQLTIGQWVLDAAPILRKIGRMTYPSKLRGRRIGGRVTLQFIVGTDGKPIPASVVVRESPEPELGAAATKMVIGSRFTPGHIGACALSVPVRQHVNYDIDIPVERREVLTAPPIR